MFKMLKFEVVVDWDKCKASKTCVNLCPTYVFSLGKVYWKNSEKIVSIVVNPDNCIGCMGCTSLCPSNAITVKPKNLEIVKIIKQNKVITEFFPQ